MALPVALLFLTGGFTRGSGVLPVWSQWIYKRKRKRGDGIEYTEKNYTARIVFGRQKEFLRGTGKSSEREAKVVAKEIANQIELIELPRLQYNPMTISEMFGRWWTEYGHEMRTADTARMRIEHLLKYYGDDLKINEISNIHINDYVQHRKDLGKAAGTINREVDILKGALAKARRRWGETTQEIFWEDFRQKEPKEKEIFVSPEEARQLIRFLPDHIKLAAAWSIYTGCRLNETETLLKANTHFELKVAQVFAKGGDMRTVAMSDRAMFVANKACNMTESEYVFDLTNRRRHWEKAKSLASRPDLRWHDLRHVTGTWLRQHANSDQKRIQHAMGHEDSSSTDRYIHVAPEEVLAALNKLPQID
ncbi:MAG: tyrosine-type recombinase/integrase [Methyloligellaceae bacterium]